MLTRLEGRLRRARAEDAGAVAVFVALIMVPVLFGMGAIVLDMGSYYAERRELQNAADSAAYAVAQDCARTSCAGFLATAQTKADANSNDGRSDVEQLCGTGAGMPGCTPAPTGTAGASYVQVKTATRRPGGSTVMPPLFAGFFPSYVPKTIRASAVVAWGNPAGGRTLPLTFSQCEFNRLVPSGVPAAPGTGTEQILFHDGNASDPCSASRSNSDAPGAFGFVNPDNSSSCVATIVNGLLPTSTGNAVPNNADCQAMLHNSTHTIANTSVLVPIFDSVCGPGDTVCVSGNGAHVTYPIIGYAQFHITGWSLGGQYYWPTGAARPCNGNATCIKGYFVRFVDLNATLGSGQPAFGVAAIKLVG